ncbi:MAG: hypothetical protein OXF56_18550 [Rhodobacteraceae bacterium]|nr:hypothetical protein [Paracoccaceae bacterium]
MGTAAQIWIEQGRTEGKAAGIMKGTADTFLRLARLKLGELSSAQTEQVRNASTEQLDSWIEAVLKLRTSMVCSESAQGIDTRPPLVVPSRFVSWLGHATTQLFLIRRQGIGPVQEQDTVRVFGVACTSNTMAKNANHLNTHRVSCFATSPNASARRAF